MTDKLEQEQETKDVLELVNGVFESPFADKNLPLQFYTENRIFSTTARARYTPPDKTNKEE